MAIGGEIIPAAERASTDYTIAIIIASSMASLNMGVYYVLAAWYDIKKFFSWTVPFRTLTFSVFTISAILKIVPASFILIACWELTGAIATGLAIYWENKRKTQHQEMRHEI
jgi:hypothetical protein